MRIAITNAVLLNTGDAAIASGILDALRKGGLLESHTDVVIFDDNAVASRRYYLDWTICQQATLPVRGKSKLNRLRSRMARTLVAEAVIAMPWLAPLFNLPFIRTWDVARSISLLGRMDVVISSGGTYLVDHYNFGSRVRELRLAKKLGAEVVLWTQSLGPFKSSRARRQVRKLGPCVDAAYFRDEKSRSAWASMVDLPLHHAVVADAAFAINPPADSGWEDARDRSIGLSVRSWNRTSTGEQAPNERYPIAVRQLVSTLIGDGYGVCAMSTCQGAPEYPIDDSAYAREILSGLQVDIDGMHHTPHELLKRLPGFSAVVATRMHLAILAILAGVPVLAIAYEFKTIELFASLGLSEYVIPIEDVTAEDLHARLETLLSRTGEGQLSVESRRLLTEKARQPAADLALRYGRAVTG